MSPEDHGTVFDRTPPFSAEAEVAVLAGMLMSKSAAVVAGSMLNEGMFYRDANRRIFRAMGRVMQNDAVVDVVTLAEALKNSGEMDAAGGFDYLAGLIDAVPTAANIEHHAAIIREKAQLRGLVEQASQIIRDVYEPGERKPSEIIAEAEQRILSVDAVSSKSGTHLLKEHLWEAFEQLERWQELGGASAGLSTGFPSLDRRTTGMHPGELWVVAGRPSMGKTSLALDIMRNVAIGGGGTTWMKSLEMDSKELTIRMIAAEGRLDLLKLRSGTKLSQDEHGRMAAAAGHLNSARIFIDDNPMSTVMELRSTARRVHQQSPLHLIVVDYMQLLEGDGRNRVDDVSKISRGLKLMARELSTPVLAVSQLSRGVEARTNKRPVLSDLRESGSIEQDADVVLMVYRPEYYMSPGEIAKAAQEKKTDPRGLAEIVIPKQRNGPTGTFPMFFDKPTTRFSEWHDRVPW